MRATTHSVPETLDAQGQHLEKRDSVKVCEQAYNTADLRTYDDGGNTMQDRELLV